MDMSFANQALSTEYAVRHAATLERKVYSVPPEIDEQIARVKLATMGVKIDTLTEEQSNYRLVGRGDLTRIVTIALLALALAPPAGPAVAWRLLADGPAAGAPVSTTTAYVALNHAGTAQFSARLTDAATQSSPACASLPTCSLRSSASSVAATLRSSSPRSCSTGRGWR